MARQPHGGGAALRQAPARRPPMNGRDATPLSVILPVLNEQDNLEILHERLTEALEPLGRDYEVIYVDDGSTDGSWEGLKKIAARDRRVRLVRFRRNFGQTPALAEVPRSEEHTSELQSQSNLVCRLLLETKKNSSA